MNRFWKSVWVVAAMVLGFSSLIPNEATAQLFRWRGTYRHSCPPVCWTPAYRHMIYDGNNQYSSTAYYGTHQTVACCEDTYESRNVGGPAHDANGQYPQPSYDAQGNRISEGWNDRPRYDAQGNRVGGNQFSDQPLFDAEGNRIGNVDQGNNQPRFDAQGNRVDVGASINAQSEFDARGNRVDADNRVDSQSQLDIAKNRVEADGRSNQTGTFNVNPNINPNVTPNPQPRTAQGASEVVPPNPIPSIRQ